MISESSRAIWLLRFFGLSSNSTFRVGVANDAKLYLEDFSSVDPKMLCSVFSAKIDILELVGVTTLLLLSFFLTIQIIKVVIVLVLVVAELFIDGAPTNIAYDAARASRLARLVLQTGRATGIRHNGRKVGH